MATNNNNTFLDALEDAWSRLPASAQVDLLTSQAMIDKGVNRTARREASPLGKTLLTQLGYSQDSRALIPMMVLGEAMVVELPVQEDPIVLLAMLVAGGIPAWSLILSPRRQLDIDRAYSLARDISAELRPTAYNRIGLQFPKPLGSLPFFAATALQVDCKRLALSDALNRLALDAKTREVYAIALAGREAIQLHGIFSKSALLDGYGGATAWTGSTSDASGRKPTSNGCGFCARATKWDTSNLFRDLAPFSEVAMTKFGSAAMTSGQVFALPVFSEIGSLDSLMSLLGAWVSLLRRKAGKPDFEGLLVERVALDNRNRVVAANDLTLAEDLYVEADTALV